ncbi:MAG: hypothetical protein sL5_06630 [Candidatus Mesenet longicola]|uniref:Uncharacterized protein n=1 Tax=Candidatus Mesenet longicola TaxID=1892558 RepID=A0A8J3HV44_9RICK|nr:MAG: hypothetical protein sGL2_06690 [Candidatus Mesenet longicola]GHM59670.1 MAG: hypothetical protein sL5_06630 [Candidatus Mesenet longicola]
MVLVGASGAIADNNKRNVKEILKAILKSVSKGDNVSIQKSYVLAKS